MKKRQKVYLVVSKDKKYTYGAFKYTPEGEKQAKSHVKQLKSNGGDFLVIEQ